MLTSYAASTIFRFGLPHEPPAIQPALCFRSLLHRQVDLCHTSQGSNSHRRLFQAGIWRAQVGQRNTHSRMNTRYCLGWVTAHPQSVFRFCPL
ncbi:uncharacterized protein METZ01_LOCUS395928, partial [marine metagenome]